MLTVVAFGVATESMSRMRIVSGSLLAP